MPSSLHISEDLSKLVDILNSHNIEFVIADAHALAFHAIPRFTEHIDFFVNRSKENVTRLANALMESGNYLDQAGQDAFVSDPRRKTKRSGRSRVTGFLSK
ncbi:MAG: hypothetical protein ACKVQS_02180 [Fimbriimonadaceae bacterium]